MLQRYVSTNTHENNMYMYTHMHAHYGLPDIPTLGFTACTWSLRGMGMIQKSFRVRTVGCPLLPDASFDTFISARLVVGRFFLEAHICHMIRANRAKTSCSSNFQVHRARIGILAPSWPIISEARGTFYPRAYKFQSKVTGPCIFHNNPISS